MRWVRDTTGRFPERPHFDRDEIDETCEALVAKFLRGTHGHVEFPLSTNDLTILVKAHTGDLDVYADLSSEGQDVEGMTEFFVDRKPSVQISSILSEDPRRQNRFRTTVTHELGHVHFHNSLIATRALPLPLYSEGPALTIRCRRDTIVGADKADWMEWQAGYASGATLAPRTYLRTLARDVLGTQFQTQVVGSALGQRLIHEVKLAFGLSNDAARVRLLQQELLVSRAPEVSAQRLF